MPTAEEPTRRARREPPTRTRGLRLAATALGLLTVAVLIGLVILWPGDVDAKLSEGLTAPTQQAKVLSVDTAPCPPPQPGTCGTARIRLESGSEEGQGATLAIGGAGLTPDLETGDSIRVTSAVAPGGGEVTYTQTDFERRTPMLLLAVVFAALVIVLVRLRGALSLVGLAISLAVIVFFVAPAILAGESPLAVSIVGSLAVMLATIALAHGVGPKGLAAMLGTSASLLLVALLAAFSVGLTNLTGLSSEEATLLNLNVAQISFDGLLVAGMVIGALGVLDDVTVSQASTVLAIRATRPEQNFSELYRSALGVGRDHVSATVNTLVFAYVGSSLPILLLFSTGGIGFFDVLNTEVVAKEVVAMLVGSIGLIAAVPMTTALTAVLARGLSEQELADAAVHAH